jgi:hypothetical protein
MPMTTVERAAMEKALKEVCVPVLRSSGFRGSFPNFYRDVDGFVSLINFQFFSSGGSFCVNLSFADMERKNIALKETETKKLNPSYGRVRARLGAPDLDGDRWFSFGPTSYGEIRGAVRSPSELAAEICQLLRDDAEAWWARHADGQ